MLLMFLTIMLFAENPDSLSNWDDLSGGYHHESKNIKVKLSINPLYLRVNSVSYFSNEYALNEFPEIEPQYLSEAGFAFAAAGSGLPFWLRYQRDGLVAPGASVNSVFNIRHSTIISENPTGPMVWGGASGTMGISDTRNRFYLDRLYVHARWNRLQLSVGRFPDPLSMNAPRLSSGSMMVSRNALQPWKIKLSTPNFISVPFTMNYVSFSASWSESVMTHDRYIKNPRIHQKTFYLRINPINDLHLIGGIVHNLVWGGEHPELGKMHGSFRTYLRDVLGQPHESSVTPLGNGIGAYDFSAHYDFYQWRFGAYRLFYIEDRVGARFRSPWDGIWGMYVEHDGKNVRLPLSYFVYEHINTKKQDARNVDAVGRARYYAHSTWVSGWTHGGHVIGNPLIMIDPNMVSSGENPLINNIVIGHHVGLSGYLSRNVSWRAMATYTRNYGTCDDQVPVTNRCIGSDEYRVSEQDEYIPLREFRRDRYSFLLGFSYWRAFNDNNDGKNGMLFYIQSGLDAGGFVGDVQTGLEMGMKIRF